MRLGVVLINWNQPQQTIDCVRSLTPILPTGSRVWIVDNSSRREDLEELDHALPMLPILGDEKNHGFAGGCNLGLRAALTEDCDPILLLNSDARIDRDNLLRLLKSSAECPKGTILGPLIYDARQPHRLLAAGGRDIGLHLSTHNDREPTTDLQPVDYVPGTCVLLPAAVLTAVGLLEERYFFAGEMADLCQRTRLAGYPVLVDRKVRVDHDPDAAGRLRDTLYAYYSLRNRFLYVRRHHSARRIELTATWLVHGLRMWRSARAAEDRERSRALRLACWHGILGRFGDQNHRILRNRDR